MMNAIGGYFSLELTSGQHYHDDAIRLNTARNAFEYILLARGYRKVYIPYYTCEVLLQPLMKHEVEYEFYSIDINFEPTSLPALKRDEAFLYSNYYGLKQECVERLSAIYCGQLIVDNAQAFFAQAIPNIDTFYSARKFFGVADGAYLYTDCRLNMELEQDKSYQRVGHLLQRIDEGAESAFDIFRANDAELDGLPMRRMSKLTEALMQNVDYSAVAQKRRTNFMALHEQLKATNKVDIDLKEAVPMVYPYMISDGDMRQKLISHRIFVAKYWPNVSRWCRATGQLENRMADCLLALPIDQRYDVADMMNIIEVIKS